MLHCKITAFVACALACGDARGASTDSGGDAGFDALVDEYYAGEVAAHPVRATELGFHDHDGELDDLGAAAVERDVARLRGFAGRFDAVDERRLSPGRAIDLAMVRRAIAGRLLELTRVQGYRRRADFYTGLASDAMYELIKRSFAPEADRLRSVCAREEKIPALLDEARRNLKDVAEVNVAITLEELPGIVGFFRDDVPRAFPSVLAPGATLDAERSALRARYLRASDGAVRALESYGAFVKSLSPRARGERDPGFALGEALYRDKLRDEEFIDGPLDALLARGEAELRRLQARYRETAAKIDPGRPFAEVQASLTADHPPPGRVLAETQARLAGLRRFLVEHDIVTVPSEVMPRVEETPPFMRATTMASMSTPGPFETRATEAMYNVTLPDAAWPKEKIEDYLRGALNRPLMDVVSIHEAFPGHYVQYLFLPRVRSKVRRFEEVHSYEEGWAHYAEQMLLDEGWGRGDPKLRLAQLQDALLRAARYVAGIRMHTRGMSLDEAVRFFEKEGYQSHEVAEMEAKRGTEDPTYLYYTWGKLEILSLRDDYRKKLGARYSLRGFHDALLAEGSIPLPLLRRALLSQ